MLIVCLSLAGSFIIYYHLYRQSTVDYSHDVVQVNTDEKMGGCAAPAYVLLNRDSYVR